MRTIALAAIWVYQRFFSGLFGPCCRFAPSCSSYAAACIERFGVARGGLYALRRILRCHPWGSHGYDPPPSTDSVNGT